MSVKISVLIPSIRRDLLTGVYQSLASSFHGDWEMVVVGPYPLPGELITESRVVWRQDFGNPTRCRQIALLASRGDYICFAADDCNFFPDSLDKAYALTREDDYKTIVLGKYSEGSPDNPVTLDPAYYKFAYHQPHQALMKRLGKDYYFVNTGLVHNKLMIEVGGFDCRYEACAMACCDISIRLQNNGAKIVVAPDPIFWNPYLPIHAGDHGPVHDG